MSNHHKTIIKLIFLICLIVLNSCYKKEKVKIAIMTKLDSGSIVGTSEVNASRIFLSNHPDHNIEIVVYDDQWKADQAVKQFAKMRKDGVDLLITSHVSTCLVAIKDQINDEKVFTMVTGAATNEITRQDDYIFRNILDVAQEQKYIAKYMKEKFKQLLIIRDTDNPAYTEPALKYFLEEYGADQVDVYNVSIDHLNIDRLKEEIKEYHYESLYLLVGGYKVKAGAIAQLISQVKGELPIMYTPWMKSPTLLETAGKSIEHSIIPSPYPPNGINKAIDEYVASYIKLYGNAPTYISLNVYRALEVFNECIRNKKTSPDQIKNYIKEKKVFESDYGTTRFDEFGDTQSELYFITDIRKEFNK